MAREILFEEQSVTGFGFVEQYGMYAKSLMPAPFALTAGEEYTVLWDDVEYTVTAIDISALFPGGVAVGNGSGFGMAGNNEPFIVAAFDTDVSLFVVDPTDTRDTHSFGIYKEVDERIVFPEQEVAFEPDGDEYAATLGNFLLTVGETYTVVFDGEECEFTAFTLEDVPYVILGDLNTGEPCLIMSASADTGMVDVDTTIISTSREGESHTVAIYKNAAEPEEPEQPEYIILRTRDGTEEEHPMRPMLEVDKVGGGTVLYSEGQSIDGIVIDPDFRAGDMTVKAQDGYLVRSAVITKPEDCKPENILKGKNIGGIPGELEMPELEDVTIEPDFSGGNMVVTPDVGKAFSGVTVTKPANLVPENIAKNEVVAGIVGTHEGGGGDRDWSDTNLKYYTYKITENGQTIQLQSISYSNMYADKGSYDVSIPEQIAGFNTEIYCG